MITRRRLLRTSAAGGLTLAAGGLAAPAIAQGSKIRVGYVSPQTGPLAGFAEADQFTIDQFLAQTGDMFEVIVKDSQSNPNRAADVAQELIIDEDVHLMLVASTPETTNPVSTVAEFEGVPLISTMAPWQPWFIGQQGNPGDPSSWQPFNYAYHYFWGLEDVIAVFTNMWDQLDTNKVVGGLFPNDADGNAWGDPQNGLTPGLMDDGYELVDPGRYQNLTDDFSAQINAFKQAGAEIVDRRRDPARLHHLLQSGVAAGLQSQGDHGRQGAPVPAGGRDAGRVREQHVVRGLVVAEPPVHILADRAERSGAGRGLH